MSRLFTLFLTLIFLCTTSTSFANKTTIIQSGVLLTFDDYAIEQWAQQIPLFEKYKAKATFFVDRFHTLSPKQIQQLHALNKADHAIGCHSVAHRKAVDTIRKVGTEEYLKIEITPAVQAMTEAGLTPTSFAYPSSQSNIESGTHSSPTPSRTFAAVQVFPKAPPFLHSIKFSILPTKS